MSRSRFPRLLLAWLAACACLDAAPPDSPSSVQSERPPNVVFILADDLGWGDLGCYGATRIKTPACDRLAAEGMRFTDAHSPSAVCSPTRYSVLTGRYAWRSWLKSWVLMENHPLLIEPERPTMGKLFQQAGYRTACIGKWHLGWGKEMNPDFSGELKPGPLEVGFDEFFGVPYSHNSGKALQVFMRDRRIVGLPDGVSWRDKQAQQQTQRRLEDTAIDLSREAVAFIDRHKDRPFFLYYPTTNIHFPLTPNPRFKGSTQAGIYGEFVAEFDWAVSEILQALERNGIADQTIVVVSSDNGGRPPGSLKEQENYGDHACNGPWRSTKRTIYEGGHRVPLIVRWPGRVKPASVSDQTVCLTDWFATFAGMLEQAIPADSAEDSVDLMPVLAGKPLEGPLREATVHHSVCGQFAIRMGDWKLIEGSGDGDYPRNAQGQMDVKSWDLAKDPATGKWTKLDYFDFKPDAQHQLFNLKADPGETRNLAAEQPERVARMLQRLGEIRGADSSR